MGAELRGLHPVFRRYVEFAVSEFAKATGVRPTITSTYRTMAEQTALYNAYVRGQQTGNPTKWPANPPGESAHNVASGALAFDSWVPDQWMPLWVWFRREIGFRVPDNDVIHAEVPGWRDIVGPRQR